MTNSSDSVGLRDSWREYKEFVARLLPIPIRDLLFHKHFEAVVAVYFLLGVIGVGAGGYMLTSGEHNWSPNGRSTTVESFDDRRHPAFQPVTQDIPDSNGPHREGTK